MTGRVEGKVAAGQGRSHAVRLTQEGADIIVLDDGAEQLRRLDVIVADADIGNGRTRLDKGRADIDASNAVPFFASDESRYVTGVSQHADAGCLLK